MNNWMKNLSDDTLVSEINLPGTHNSGAFRVNFPLLSKCQNMSIPQQLEAGIRFLDIRVEKDGEKLKLVHSVADCKNPSNRKEKLYLDTVIKDCRNFLRSTPSETVLFCLNRDDGASAEDTFDTFYKNCLCGDTFWYKENRIPTLKEVRGKIVLLNRCRISTENEEYTDFNTGINLSNWVYQKNNTEKIFETAELLGRNGTLTGTSFTVQDLYGLNPQKKWKFALSPFIKNPPETKGGVISFFSCANIFNTPKRNAKYINKKLSKTSLKKAKKYGWIIMDYPTEKFIKEIINSNF